ncbi:transducin family protein [Pyrenophora tritici-repentis]|nr:hypothetical protein PtrV1_10204 [Pyrenophora tritici-repentis]KAI1541640.1 transducin family protein [Pyrenophora tritici-repentis]KAI1549969.1 transducin family protein [Pyrenophora tritici-repentis]KAI1577262.1 transducin family protein [Pyrenophora tritici-repentis]
MRDLVFYPTCQYKVVGGQDLELFAIFLVLFLSALHCDVGVVLVVFVEDQVLCISEHGHGVALVLGDFVIVVLKIVLFKVVIVVPLPS